MCEGCFLDFQQMRTEVTLNEKEDGDGDGDDGVMNTHIYICCYVTRLNFISLSVFFFLRTVQWHCPFSIPKAAGGIA